ncbi:MAG: ABC transporter permease [Deltaproteobacteria bacterium]|nr:ABC transporter permease [Deltaproteobacteria bacterium]
MGRRLGSVSALVAKDLLRQFRAPLGTVLILIFPLVFSGLLAVSFGGPGKGVPKVRLLIEDHDGGIVGNLIRSAFTAEQAAPYFDLEVVKEGGRERIEDGSASALLRLPKHLTRDLLHRRPATLELVKNPAETILPEVAEQVSLVLAEVLGSAAYVLDEPLGVLQPYLDEDVEALPDATVATVAMAINQVVGRAEPYVFPSVIKLETVSLAEEEEGSDAPAASVTASIFLTIFPGIAVFALFTLGDHLMRDLLKEKALGTLRRQLFGPIGTGHLILSKVLTTALIAGLSLILLAAIAGWVAERGVSLPGFLALSLALILAVTGSAAVINGFAADERQATTIGSVIYLVMAFSGGSFISLEGMPRSVQAIAPFSPFYWGTEGFKTLLLSRGSLADVVPNIGVLATLGLVLLFFGAFLLRRSVRQGALA